MSLIRVQEPQVLTAVKSFFWQCFGIHYEEDLDHEVKGTLIQFLTSSVTVELVHLILKTVSEYTVGTSKGSEKVYQGYDFKNKNSFTLDAIEIENPENWTVGTPSAKKSNHKAFNLAEGSASLHNDEKNLLVINEDMVVTEYAPDVFA